MCKASVGTCPPRPCCPRFGKTREAQTARLHGIFTPYGEEKHISNYMSFFGHDIEAGESASARSPLVVLPDPTEAEVLEIADEFLIASP